MFINIRKTENIYFKVKNEPPYCVKESGYGMFEFPIEIYFNGTNETYKINYYLELQGIDDRKPFSRLRKETITFQNPQPEFRKCLLDGGGILKSLDSTTSPLNIFQQQSVPIVTSQNSPDKLTNPATIIYQPQIKHESTTFSDLFGQPVERKTKKVTKFIAKNLHFYLNNSSNYNQLLFIFFLFKSLKQLIKINQVNKQILMMNL